MKTILLKKKDVTISGIVESIGGIPPTVIIETNRREARSTGVSKLIMSEGDCVKFIPYLYEHVTVYFSNGELSIQKQSD